MSPLHLHAIGKILAEIFWQNWLIKCIGDDLSNVTDFRFLLAPRFFGMKTHMTLSVTLMELGFSSQSGDLVTQVRPKGMRYTLYTLSSHDEKPMKC